jgi:hypothetical protein
MKLFVYITIFIVLTNFVSSNEQIIRSIMKEHLTKPYEEAFKVWHYLHQKTYSLTSEKGLKRYENFKRNYDKVNSHSQEKNNFSIGLNRFADLSIEEFKAKFLFKKGFIPTHSNNKKLKYLSFWDTPEENDDEYFNTFLKYSNNKSTLKSVDWREKAKLNLQVENQRHCGSCWAFSTIGAVQAAYTIKTGKLEYFSKQQLVDCDKVSSGCDGGMPHSALDYIKVNGIERESDYPYLGTNQTCKILNNKNFIKISSYESKF